MRVNLVSWSNSSNNGSVLNNNRKQTAYNSFPIKLQNVTDTVAFGQGNPAGIVRKLPVVDLLAEKFNFLDHVTNIRMKFGNYEIPIHNPRYAAYMKESYTSKSFNKLFKHADSNGAFNYSVNKENGFVKTSVISSEEDYKMADAIWVTDTCRNMSLLKAKEPELCTKAVESLSNFYKQQEPEFEKVIANPEIFKSHNGWGDGGVGHVFNPNTYEVNRDFPKTRLESIGHYLQRSTELIINGLGKGANYGYKTSEAVGENTVESIANCVKYLKAINYPQSRSCGAWEEQTFNSSLLSDTSIINEGFRRVFKLMYGKTDNPEILKIRERIMNSRNGDVFKDNKSLIDLLKNGQERIILNHSEEAPGQRKLDAAMSFVSHYEGSRLTGSSNVAKDVREHIKLLESLEGDVNSRGLVGENGVARYLGDEYKNLNYDRVGRRDENREAQWFMVSDISKGYGVQLKRLIKSIAREDRKPTDEEMELIKKTLNKETEYINRSYARDTGKGLIKANDKPCPEYKTPEAYQAVTNEQNQVEYRPGSNTPLAWAQSSKYDASELFESNLITLEKYGWLDKSTSITPNSVNISAVA